MKTFELISSPNKVTISVMLMGLFHFCGLIGIQSQYRDWFLDFTPLNLLISTFLLFWNQEKINKNIVLSFMLVFALGLTIEIIGVKTGMIFGTYKYGETFGFRFMEVPVVIGMNWAALCFASSSLANRIEMSTVKKALLLSLIPVSIDYFIEQLCEKLNFWYWQDSHVPIQNFISWYIFTFIFSLILIPLFKNNRNKFAPYFLFIQFIFFVFLNITML